MELGIRWKQRFSSYVKALGQLQKFIEKGELRTRRPGAYTGI